MKIERPAYIVIAEKGSTLKPYNRTIRVYRVTDNAPTLIGMNNELHTAAYRGDMAEAAAIINKVDGYPLSDDKYNLADSSVKIFNLSTV